MQIIQIGLNSENTKGCERSPHEILKELRNIQSTENGERIKFENLSFSEVILGKDMEESFWNISQKSREAFEKNFKCFFLGGDHYISYPILSSFKKKEENPFLIIFDSHADCLSQKDNRGWLRNLVEEGFNNIILIAARNLNEDEIYFLKDKKITWIKIDVLKEEIREVCDMIMERARLSSGFYMSIDMDCIDPAFAPGVNDLEAGGLSSRDIIYLVKRLSLLDNFRGGDIVEINPMKDVRNITVKLGARILSEML